jgi:C-5 cytosine-specific DNA methylase
MAHSKPLAIELFAGLFGWGEGLVAEGWETIGFDIVDMHKELGLTRRPEFQLVLQDVRTLHGRQFKDVALIIASPPCQAYSYRAMPWKRAKALPPPSNELFEACFRIQREAIDAAGHFIPLVVENVKGAQPWVGRARWNFGSFYLWGDVPALMPMTKAIKNNGGSWFNIAHNTTSGHGRNPDGRLKDEGVIQRGSGREWFAGEGKISRLTSSGSPARKAASALIAKIPLALSSHIARVYRPRNE